MSGARARPAALIVASASAPPDVTTAAPPPRHARNGTDLDCPRNLAAIRGGRACPGSTHQPAAGRRSGEGDLV